MRAITLYAWEDAPERYRQLSRHGGDEDIVAVGPMTLFKAFMPFEWMIAEYVQWLGWSDVHYSIEKNVVVIVYAHA